VSSVEASAQRGSVERHHPFVRVAMLARDGSSLGARDALVPDPAPMVRQCLDTTGDTAFLEGHAIFDVSHVESAPAEVKRAVDLPAALVTCIAAGLEGTRPGPAAYDPGAGLVYVAIGVE